LASWDGSDSFRPRVKEGGEPIDNERCKGRQALNEKGHFVGEVEFGELDFADASATRSKAIGIGASGPSAAGVSRRARPPGPSPVSPAAALSPPRTSPVSPPTSAV
jgi:hypothetical protein